MSVNLINNAVTAHVASVNADRTAEDAFSASALSFLAAVDAGVTVKTLVDALKAAKKDGKAVEYTAAGIIGSHARTGRVVGLVGDLPAGVSLRSVQASIKALPAKVVDSILAECVTKVDALERLANEVRILAEQAAAEAASEAEGSADEDAAEPVVKTAIDYLTALQGTLGKALALVAAGERDEATLDLLRVIQQQMGDAVADAIYVNENQDSAVLSSEVALAY